MVSANTQTSLSMALLYVHIIGFVVGVLALFLSFLAGNLLIVQNRLIKNKWVNRMTAWLPSIQALDRVVLWSILIGFPFMTLGAAFGVLLAHGVWGVEWMHDPMVILTFFCWLWYAALIVFRLFLGWRGLRLSLLNLFGFCALLFTLFGLRFIGLPGSHALF